MIHNIEDVIDKIQRFKQLGIKLAIDDFGTGYSSLAYLKHFKIDTIKIDRAFIRDINEDLNDMAIAASVASLSGILGINALAEGVETRAQVDLLQELGIDLIQGYLLGKPMPQEEFEQLLGNSSRQEGEALRQSLFKDNTVESPPDSLS